MKQRTQISIILVLASLAVLSIAHPAKFHGASRNVSCVTPQPAEVLSYHIHLVYWQTNPQQVTDAYKIRDSFISKFKPYLGPDCHDLFHNTVNCMLDPDLGPGGGGPFCTANWSVFVLPNNLEPMMRWMVQHRGQFSVLVHPNSGCEVEDHSDWAFWSGQAYALDMTIFSHD